MEPSDVNSENHIKPVPLSELASQLSTMVAVACEKGVYGTWGQRASPGTGNLTMTDDETRKTSKDKGFESFLPILGKPQGGMTTRRRNSTACVSDMHNHQCWNDGASCTATSSSDSSVVSEGPI
jgi:hypothetical protein